MKISKLGGIINSETTFESSRGAEPGQSCGGTASVWSGNDLNLIFKGLKLLPWKKRRHFSCL